MELKGSKTEAVLWQAYADECKARTKYEFFAAQARKDGYQQIAALFDETARNEKEHAEMWYKELHGNQMPQTLPALKEAAQTENHEWTDLYKDYAKTAREEGFDQIAALFEQVGEIERQHEDRYRKLIENIEGGLVFSRDGDTVWQCIACGHIVVGRKAPDTCPVCGYAQGYFQIKAENY